MAMRVVRAPRPVEPPLHFVFIKKKNYSFPSFKYFHFYCNITFLYKQDPSHTLTVTDPVFQYSIPYQPSQLTVELSTKLPRNCSEENRSMTNTERSVVKAGRNLCLHVEFGSCRT